MAEWTCAACGWQRKTRQIWSRDTLKVIETLWSNAEEREEVEWGEPS